MMSELLWSRKALRGPHYHLIPLTEADVSPHYVEWVNDPEVNRHLEVRFRHQTEDTVRAYVRSFYEETEKYIWGIRVAQDRLIIGTTTLYDINRHHGTAEIGLMIGEKRFWGTGASLEAMALVIEHAFADLSLRRVTGGSYATNYAIGFVYKRLGFTPEGVMRKAYMLTPGVYVDGLRWGLLVEDWLDHRAGRAFLPSGAG